LEAGKGIGSVPVLIAATPILPGGPSATVATRHVLMVWAEAAAEEVVVASEVETEVDVEEEVVTEEAVAEEDSGVATVDLEEAAAVEADLCVEAVEIEEGKL